MSKIFVPPIKIQGIKTKLVPWIIENLPPENFSTWFEPFMGSGVVGFNVRPKRAIFADINPHIINFYNALKSREISSDELKYFLTEQGKILSERGENFYLEVRERFNKFRRPQDFLFLNRACFNGMIRFNRAGKFNVPFNHKPHRFSKAYVTKIFNQLRYVEECFELFDWNFVCQDFRETISQAKILADVFIYCDPPYLGRHADYFDAWNEISETELCAALKNSGTKFMLSTWDHNDFRKNSSVETHWNFCNKASKNHFYHVGASEQNRHSMVETILTNY